MHKHLRMFHNILSEKLYTQLYIYKKKQKKIFIYVMSSFAIVAIQQEIFDLQLPS